MLELTIYLFFIYFLIHLNNLLVELEGFKVFFSMLGARWLFDKGILGLRVEG